MWCWNPELLPIQNIENSPNQCPLPCADTLADTWKVTNAPKLMGMPTPNLRCDNNEPNLAHRAQPKHARMHHMRAAGLANATPMTLQMRRNTKRWSRKPHRCAAWNAMVLHRTCVSENGRAGTPLLAPPPIRAHGPRTHDAYYGAWPRNNRRLRQLPLGL